MDGVEQRSPNYDPLATSGPIQDFIWLIETVCENTPNGWQWMHRSVNCNIETGTSTASQPTVTLPPSLVQIIQPLLVVVIDIPPAFTSDVGGILMGMPGCKGGL